MTVQKGKSLLLKIGGGDGPPETFNSVAGLRAKQIQFDNQTVDVTNASSTGGWREILADAGVRRITITGNGLFLDQASDEKVRSVFFSQSLVNWQIIVPDFGALEGAFQISALEYAGDYNGAVSFSVTLQSSGVISFTSA